MMQINSNFGQIGRSDHLPILQKVGKPIEKFELKEMKFQVHSGKSLEISMITYDEKSIDKIMKIFESVLNGVQNEA